MTTHEAIAWIIEHFEGGFVDHADDRGGPTKYGITQKTLSDARGQAVSKEDVADLSHSEAVDILTTAYAERPGYTRIQHPWVRLAVIDFAIHSGPRRATQALQRAAGAVADGFFGPKTEARVNRAPTTRLVKTLTAARLTHWANIVKRDSSQRVFLVGWIRRLATLLDHEA